MTNRQVTNLRKAFANYLSTDIKVSKTKLSKMIQSGGFLGRLFGLLLKQGLLLMKTVLKPLAKIVLITLGLTSAASAAGAGIHEKKGSGSTTLIISNEEMEGIMKIVKSLKDYDLLLKGVSESYVMKLGVMKSMLLGALGANLLGNMLAGKGIVEQEME